MTKLCPKCSEVKSKLDFNKNSTTRDGLQGYCRVCSKAAFKAYVKPTPRVVQDGYKHCRTCKIDSPKTEFVPNINGSGGHYSVCRKCCSDRNKKAATNPAERAKRKADSAKYTRNNREAANIKSAIRRANRLSRTPSWVDSEFESLFVAEIYHLAKLREQAVGFKWQVDHMVPFISEAVCGFHCSDNMQLIPAVENLSKGNKYWPDMP